MLRVGRSCAPLPPHISHPSPIRGAFTRQKALVRVREGVRCGIRTEGVGTSALSTGRGAPAAAAAASGPAPLPVGPVGRRCVVALQPFSDVPPPPPGCQGGRWATGA